MRVCELHMKRAVLTLRDQDGIEYDLCPECKEMMDSILSGLNNDLSQKFEKSRRKEMNEMILENTRKPDGTGRTLKRTRIHKK